jgi:hypothetical protein
MMDAPAPDTRPDPTATDAEPRATVAPGPTGRVPAVIDLEASGFGRDSYPIEVGFVLEDGRAGCTLIRPEPDWTHWDPGAERTHGIARQTVLHHGRPTTDVADWLNGHLAGRTVYTDGWAHDYGWLARLFEAAGRTPRFRLGHLRALLDDAQASVWQDRLDALRRDGASSGRHRASVDARQVRRALAHALRAR